MTYIKGEKIIHFKKQVKKGDMIFSGRHLVKVLEIGEICYFGKTDNHEFAEKFYYCDNYKAVEQKKSIKQQIIDECKSYFNYFNIPDDEKLKTIHFNSIFPFIKNIKKLAEQLED